MIYVHSVYGQLVVEYDGDVKLHYPIPEDWCPRDNVIALFSGDIYVSGEVYQDIPVGIDPIRKSTTQKQMSPINTCMLLRKLLSPTNGDTTINRDQVIDSLQQNDSPIIFTKKDGEIAVKYTELISTLVSAISDLQDEINILKKRLNSETDKH